MCFLNRGAEFLQCIRGRRLDQISAQFRRLAHALAEFPGAVGFHCPYWRYQRLEFRGMSPGRGNQRTRYVQPCAAYKPVPLRPLERITDMVAGRHVPYHRDADFLIALQEAFRTEGVDNIVFQVPGAGQFEGNVRMQVVQTRQYPFPPGIDFPCIFRHRAGVAQGNYVSFNDENAGIGARLGPGPINQSTARYPIRFCKRVTAKQQQSCFSGCQE